MISLLLQLGERKKKDRYLQKSRQFFLCIKNHDHKWRAWNMLTAPFDFQTIVSWFGWLIFTQDRAILLRFTLHFHTESTCLTTKKVVVVNS